jgi:predicted nucleic acid-binding Zn ribbon protein
MTYTYSCECGRQWDVVKPLNQIDRVELCECMTAGYRVPQPIMSLYEGDGWTKQGKRSFESKAKYKTKCNYCGQLKTVGQKCLECGDNK